MPGVAAVDYVSSSLSLPQLYPFDKILFLRQPKKLPTKKVVILRLYDIIFGKFRHTMLVLLAMVRKLMCRYIGIPTTIVVYQTSDWDGIYAVFSGVTQ